MHPPPGERVCPVDQLRLVARRVRLAGPVVTVDDCPRCGGVFLDADELLLLSADDRLNAALRHRGPADEVSGRFCPHCRVRMDPEQARGVELEACPKCHGLWLDRGELRKLAGADPVPVGEA
jgi:Zn-finger nucleic acid-binding protein